MENSVALHFYYIAQESVLNAIKHGKAAHVTISLAQSNGSHTLIVEDDGIGFNSPAVGQTTGMGIRIMRYRARVIGGTLDLKNRPDHGTQIKCEVRSTAKVKEVKH